MKSLTLKLGKVLALYGVWGLFAISFLDSSFVPLPGLNDVLLILMASKRPMWWPFYALASTLGSVGGAYLLYGMARGGGSFFSRKTKAQPEGFARRWLKENDFLAVLVTSLLPPPAPLKAFIVTAGLLRVNAVRFGFALLVGRGLRFGAEAWLGARYGTQAQDFVRQNLGRTSLVAVALIVAIALVHGWWKVRFRPAAPPATELLTVDSKPSLRSTPKDLS